MKIHTILGMHLQSVRRTDPLVYAFIAHILDFHESKLAKISNSIVATFVVCK